MTAVFVLAYLAAIVLANYLVAYYGPAIAPGVAFVLIGLDLVVRDRLHDAWRGRALWPRMLGLVVTGGLISLALNAGIVAIASCAAFVLGGLADAAAYQLLGRRPFLERSNGSNVAGAAVDSVVFLAILGALSPFLLVLQLAAKIAGGFVWSIALEARRR